MGAMSIIIILVCEYCLDNHPMTIEFLISREIIFSVSYFSSELGTLHSSYDFFMEYLEIFLNMNLSSFT